MDKKIKYLGLGFYQGLPARDMTLQEWKSYPKELIAAAIKAGLYKVVTTKKDGKQWD